MKDKRVSRISGEGYGPPLRVWLGCIWCPKYCGDGRGGGEDEGGKGRKGGHWLVTSESAVLLLLLGFWQPRLWFIFCDAVCLSSKVICVMMRMCCVYTLARRCVSLCE